jgi:hypothetical protein
MPGMAVLVAELQGDLLLKSERVEPLCIFESEAAHLKRM